MSIATHWYIVELKCVSPDVINLTLLDTAGGGVWGPPLGTKSEISEIAYALESCFIGDLIWHQMKAIDDLGSA